MQISFVVIAKLISAFVFATRIVQFLFFLNPKFPVSSHHLCLYSSVCVGHGRKPRRPVFSHRGSNEAVQAQKYLFVTRKTQICMKFPEVSMFGKAQFSELIAKTDHIGAKTKLIIMCFHGMFGLFCSCHVSEIVTEQE